MTGPTPVRRCVPAPMSPRGRNGNSSKENTTNMTTLTTVELQAKRHEIAYCQALGYVWGRQDAGESTKDTGVSIEFAAAYRDRLVLFTSEQVWFMPNIKDAFEEWRQTGRIS